MPNVEPQPEAAAHTGGGANEGWLMNGIIVRAIRFNFGLSMNGTTGWMFKLILEAGVWADAIVEIVLKRDDRNVSNRILRRFDDRLLNRRLLRRRQLAEVESAFGVGASCVPGNGAAGGEACGAVWAEAICGITSVPEVTVSANKIATRVVPHAIVPVVIGCKG